MTKNIMIALLPVIIGLGLGYYLYNKPPEPVGTAPTITSFTECAAAGYPVSESYPRQCGVPGGLIFTEDIGNVLVKQNLIQVTSPRPGDVITSPLKIKGRARGTWYFEASFPVSLLDANNQPIPLSPSYIMAAGDWMTNDFVPFEASLTFAAPATPTGSLILHKNNPSGLPEHDDQLVIPVNF